MSSRPMARTLRSTLYPASILAAVLAGIAGAAAQPGADFQDRGIREDMGLSPYASWPAGGYRYVPERSFVTPLERVRDQRHRKKPRAVRSKSR
jgi:hypothetical protein